MCVIDNDSDDRTVKIAQRWLGRGVIEIKRQSYAGKFDLVAQCQMQEAISHEIKADWFIHQDADEIREAPTHTALYVKASRPRTRQATTPLTSTSSYSFQRLRISALRAPITWRRCGIITISRPRHKTVSTLGSIQTSLLTSQQAAGHGPYIFHGRRISPENFILRHYIALLGLTSATSTAPARSPRRK